MNENALPQPFDELPEMMLEAFGFGMKVSRLQRERVSLGSIKIARIQNMRSMLGSLIHDEMTGAELIPDHFGLGKVHFRMRATGEEFVLKSDRFRQREMGRKIDNISFDGLKDFEAPREFVTVVFYRFEPDILILKAARSEVIRDNGSSSYFLIEDVRTIGTFEFASTTADGFEQGDDDVFGDIDLDIDDEDLGS